MGKLKDLLLATDTTPFGSDQPLPEVHVFDLTEYELPGQILVTIYSDRLTIAHRSRQSDRWSAPRTAKRITQ